MKKPAFDEEGLLKYMEISELALKISKLTYGWENHSDPLTQAYKLMNKAQKISVEVSEYQQRMGSNLTEYQKSLIYNSLEDLEKLIPYLKKKITATTGVENILD